MRHMKGNAKLGRPTAHRLLMLRNMVSSLLESDRVRLLVDILLLFPKGADVRLDVQITTTIVKAKAAQRVAEHVITWGKKIRQLNEGPEGQYRRRAVNWLMVRLHKSCLDTPADWLVRLQNPKRTVPKLVDVIAPRYMDRAGGYTRVFHYGHRKGDHAPTAILELVDNDNDVKFALTARILGRELATAERESTQGSVAAAWRNSSVPVPPPDEVKVAAEAAARADADRGDFEAIAKREAEPLRRSESVEEVVENVRRRYSGLPIQPLTAVNILKCLRYRTTADLARFDELAKQSFDRTFAEAEIGIWKADEGKRARLEEFDRGAPVGGRTVPGSGIKVAAGAPRPKSSSGSSSADGDAGKRSETEWEEYDVASSPWKRAAGWQRRSTTSPRESRMGQFGRGFE
jgi:ribosomal protein L17